MGSLFEIIVGNPTLPENFISSMYDKFLFFDIDLRYTLDLFDEIQSLSEETAAIHIFYAETFEVLSSTWLGEKWSEKISSVVYELEKEKRPFGLVVLESNEGWVIVQDTPVNWGVFAFNSLDKKAFEIFNNIDKGWFLSIEDFQSAINDSSSRLREYFDVKFMEDLVLNFSVNPKR